MAQAQHGSAPDIAGQDRANPASLIGSAAMLLAWLGERRKAERLTRAAAAIEAALDRAIGTPEWRTRDLGGPLGTKAFGERVAALVKEAAASQKRRSFTPSPTLQPKSDVSDFGQSISGRTR